jgi:hypothetical protein
MTAGDLFNCTGLIGLVQRIYDAYATLRDTRPAIAEVAAKSI